MGKSTAKKEKAERINALRKKYDDFLNEDKKRKERNEDILGRLDKMRSAALALRYSNQVSGSIPTHMSMTPFKKQNLVEATMQIIPVNKPDTRNIISSINLDENELLNKISEKYILIPRLTTLFLDDTNKHPKKTNEDDDWTSKYEILDQLKKSDKGKENNNIHEYVNKKNQRKSKHISFDDNTETKGLYNLKRDVIEHSNDLSIDKITIPHVGDNNIDNDNNLKQSKTFKINTDTNNYMNRDNDIKVMNNKDITITNTLLDELSTDVTKDENSDINNEINYVAKASTLNVEKAHNDKIYETIIQPNKSYSYNEDKIGNSLDQYNKNIIDVDLSEQQTVETSQLVNKQVLQLNDLEQKSQVQDQYVHDKFNGQQDDQTVNNSEYVKVHDQYANNIQQNNGNPLNILEEQINGDKQQYSQSHYDQQQYNQDQLSLQSGQILDINQYNIDQPHHKEISKQDDQQNYVQTPEQGDQKQYFQDQYNLTEQQLEKIPDEDDQQQYVQDQYNVNQHQYKQIPEQSDQQYVHDQYNMNQQQYEQTPEQSDQQQYDQEHYQQQYEQMPKDSDQQEHVRQQQYEEIPDQQEHVQDPYQQHYEQIPDQQEYVQEHYQQQYEQMPKDGDQQEHVRQQQYEEIPDQQEHVQDPYQQHYEQIPDQQEYLQDQYQQQYEQIPDQQEYVQDQYQQHEQMLEHNDQQYEKVTKTDDDHELQNDQQLYAQEQYNMNQQQYDQIQEQMVDKNIEQKLGNDQEHYSQELYNQNEQIPIEQQDVQELYDRQYEQTQDQADLQGHIQEHYEQVSSDQQHVQE